MQTDQNRLGFTTRCENDTLTVNRDTLDPFRKIAFHVAYTDSMYRHSPSLHAHYSDTSASRLYYNHPPRTNIERDAFFMDEFNL